MDAKAMKKVSESYKKVSEAQSGIRMGKVLKAIVDAVVLGESKAEVDFTVDVGLEKYISDLGYKVDNASTPDKTLIGW